MKVVLQDEETVPASRLHRDNFIGVKTKNNKYVVRLMESPFGFRYYLCTFHNFTDGGDDIETPFNSLEMLARHFITLGNEVFAFRTFLELAKWAGEK